MVLTRDSVIGYLNEVTVASVTSTVRDIPSEVYLNTHDGIPLECAVNCDHIQTVAKAKVGALITTLSSDQLAELRRAVGFALGLQPE